MSWVALLDAVHGLHRVGMSVPMTLEQHARSGEGPSQRLAHRWLRLRLRHGDPVDAMRAMGGSARTSHDRFVLETLAICLERSAGGQVLDIATRQLRDERASGYAHRWPFLSAPESLVLGLVQVALSGGDDVTRAADRVVEVFGSRRADRARAVLNRADRGAIPLTQAVANAVTEAREAQAQRRATLTVLPRAVAVASALTVTALGVIAPGSTELGLAGW